MTKQNNKNRKAMPAGRQGFTLIELIVVITIIAVVTVIGVINFGGVNKKARDSRRMSDLEKIRIALELIRQVGTTYPAALNALTPNYLQSIPNDPKAGFNYLYNNSGPYTYTLSASVEDLGNTNIAAFSGCGSANCNYQITNP